MTAAPVMMPQAQVDAPPAAPAEPARTRPFYWSVRRELWENRFVWQAPLVVAAFGVVALVIHAVTMPSHMPGMLANDPAAPDSASVTYRVMSLLMLATAFVTGAFYSLEALSGERRDRSILFWKSLPVSDRTTVLAKATVPLVILPVVTFAATVAMHLALLLLSSLALGVQGQSPGPLWSEVNPPRMWGALLYAVPLIALWQAPTYGVLLLVSGWARRMAVLWAVLPLLALGLLEKLTMDTLHVALFVVRRVAGWHDRAFADPPRDGMPFGPASAITPGRFLSSPELWIGLAVAALCIAAAVRLRRSREPV